MRPLERIIATFNGTKTDRIPVDAWWSKEIFEKIKSERGENPIIHYGLDARRIFTEASLLENRWQEFLGVREKEISVYQYPFPEIEMAETKNAGLDARVIEIKNAGYPAIGHIGSVCFEAIQNIIGMQELFMAIYDKYDIVDEICEDITNIKIGMAARLVGAGVDIIHMGDDFGSQRGLLISPDTWRKLFKPKIEKTINAIKDIKEDCLIFFHSDGDVTNIIMDLIEIGVDFLNPVQPECMDIREISKKYGGKVAFWGGVGTQDTFYRDKDFIFKTVKDTIEILGQAKKLIISPTHMIQGDVPLENIDYFFEAVKLYGSSK